MGEFKRVTVTEDSESKNFYKHYHRILEEISESKQILLENPVRPSEDGLKIADRNKLFDEGDLAGEFGIFPLEEGGHCVANREFFRGSKGEMLQWWFAWHGIHPLRYAIWDPLDHYGIEVSDEDKAYIHNTQTSIPDKCREVHHTLSSLYIGFKCINQYTLMILHDYYI